MGKSNTSHVTIKTASTAAGVPEKTLRDKTRQKSIPLYFVKKANRWYIDMNHPEWREYMKKRNQAQAKKSTKPSAADKIMTDLYNKSKAAGLKEQILKTQKLEYLVEKERLALQKAAQEVVEVGFAEFLYYGYMEKMNIDLLGMMKRLAPIIDNLVKTGDAEGVRRRIEKEITAIIHEVKKAQTKEISSWRKEETKNAG